MRVIGGNEAGRRLAAALAERIAPVVPAGIRVTAEADTLWAMDDARCSGTALGGILEPGVAELPGGATGIWMAEEPGALADTVPAGGGDDEPELELDDFREFVATAVANALSRIQDFVTEAITTPWPPPYVDKSGPVLPEVGVEWSGPDLNVWFGDEHQPDLRLPPIPMHELVRPARETREG